MTRAAGCEGAGLDARAGAGRAAVAGVAGGVTATGWVDSSARPAAGAGLAVGLGTTGITCVAVLSVLSVPASSVASVGGETSASRSADSDSGSSSKMDSP